MLGPLLIAAALAQVPTCVRVGMGAVTDVPAPGVIVLGERPGAWPDLVRAERLVTRLARQGKVTVAFQAVKAEKQPVLDQYNAGDTALSDLPELVEWTAGWAMPWTSYEGLFAVQAIGARMAAVGQEVALRPNDTPIPMPPGYLNVLIDAAGEHAVPVEIEPMFVQTVAYLDHRMARAALDAWDGEGWLVVIADRLHVEGGLGIQWQLERMAEVPVHAFLLADGEGTCYPADRILRDHPLQK